MMTTLMRMTQDKGDLGGGTNDRGFVDVVRNISIPGETTLEQGLLGSGAKAFLLSFSKERRLC